MKYQKIINYDIANGPGIRTTLFVSGCNHRCKGCHNPTTWNPLSGEEFNKSTIDKILISLSPDHIKGLSISGGDPLYPDNRQSILELLKIVKLVYPTKDIWMWTGYLYEDIKDLDIMNYIDVLVDGPFILDNRDITHPYHGSSNQRVIDVKSSKSKGDIMYYVSEEKR